MTAQVLPSSGIALLGAPDSDIGAKDAKPTAIQAMQLEMTQDVVDELLESVRNGKPPQILLGRTPQLKYGDKSHVLKTSSGSFRYELYQSSGSADKDLTFAGLINHSLAVQKAEEVTSGVDKSLEQLKNSMAAISELKEANKTIVGNAASSSPHGHRRGHSKSLKSQFLNPNSHINSPLRSIPSSPALGAQQTASAPRSQPDDRSDSINALRRVLIHLLAIEPRQLSWLYHTTGSSSALTKEVLVRIAKNDSGTFSLFDKYYKELDPYNFPYKTSADRQKAIESAIKGFDRLRLPKEDNLWQILLPREERGKGKTLSRLHVQAPAQKTSTPMHNISKLTEKKPAKGAKGEKGDKTDEKDGEKKVKEVKEKKPAKPASEKTSLATTKTTSTKSTPNNNKSADTSKIRTKKVAATTEGTTTPRAKPGPKPKTTARDPPPNERVYKPSRPAMSAANTKPKNPSPLSASPPVNASDFEDSHPVHKALSGAPSPAKSSNYGNSDRSLKRKANDLDHNIHDHNLSVKQPRKDRATPQTTPQSVNGRLNGSTPSSANSLKRKVDDSSSSSTTPSTKARKMNNIDTSMTRYNNNNNNNNPISPTSSSSTTSPTVPSLSFRQTVEMSQKFQKYYEKYHKLYMQLADAPTAPTDTQRDELMKMHKKLEEMKRDIKAGAMSKR